MLVLHAGWVRGRLWIWGETALRTDTKAVSEVNPFSANSVALIPVVKGLCGGSRRPWFRMRHLRTVKARLPSFNGRVLPSRAYFMPSSWQPIPELEKYPIKETFVYALPLSLPETLILFANIIKAEKPSKSLLGNIVAGNDLISLARIWKLASAVIARERVLPGISGDRSRWIPAMDAEGNERADKLFAAVPSSALALEDSSQAQDFFEDAIDLQMRIAVTTTLSRSHSSKGLFYDLHSAWIASLRSYNSIVRWNNKEEIEAFAKELAKWRKPIEYIPSEKEVLGFRIDDPNDPGLDEPKWTLLPVVVADDRTIPLSDKYLETVESNTRYRLLVSLGQASDLIGRLSKDSPPGSGAAGAVRLDAYDLRTFMNEDAPRLKAAGFPVFAPSWWPASLRGFNKPKIRVKSISPNTSQGLFSLDTLLEVKWEIVLGGDVVAADDIKWMVSSNSPIVRLGSRWIAVDAKELRSVMERVESLSKKTISLRDLVQLSMGFGGVPIEIPNEALPKELERKSIPSVLNGTGKIDSVNLPRGFNGKLRAYQHRGLDWLSFLHKWGFGACLADDMGLGKTIEAIALFLAAREYGAKGPILVICPMSIMLKWHREISLFAPSLKTLLYHGAERQKGDDFISAIENIDVVITSYQLLCTESATISKVEWEITVLDEAQNIKNASTAKSRTARALKSHWRLALTGTPVENNVGDLWAIMDFLNPGLLLNQRDFIERYQRPIAMGSDPSIKDELRHLTAPFILRRLKSDPEIVPDMPPKVEEKVYCTLTKKQAELYAAEIRDIDKGIAHKEGIARHGAVLSLLTRLKQICNHPEQYQKITDAKGRTVSAEDSGKLMRLDEMLDDVISAGECALVFTQYATMGEMLAKHLSEKFGFEVPFLHGQVPMKKRDAMVASFQRKDGPPIFIVSIKAGGIGLDLTRANHVFHFDRWWNPAVENQATDRAHRIGQKRTVFVHTFICEGTLESRIDDLISSKLELAEKLISSGDNWIASLDDKTLREIVELSSNIAEGGE